MSNKCLYIFIRDLRISDNDTYSKALKIVGKSNIYPVFFYNKEQLKGPYSSPSAVNFFSTHLNKFSKENSIQLINVKNLNDLLNKIKVLYNKYNFKYIAYHYDYTPYAVKRQELIEKFCKEKYIKLINTHDQLLLKDFHLKSDSTNYSKFTPYYKSYPFKKIDKVTFKNFSELKDIINNYSVNRNNISSDTTRLSVYLKFGLISPRQAYSLFSSSKLLIQQLVWRDFYYTYYYFNPDTLILGDNNIKYNWNEYNTSNWFKHWQNGTTGIPIVDAGMRQLKKENFMHNRVRMITASTLSKLMGIDWKLGEKHFSNLLRDIDRIQNTAGWQSVVGIAKHSLPYFRVFNPWIQSKKYDPDCKYIKKYIPELKNVPAKDIHNWEIMYKNYKVYKKPIFNYSVQKKIFFFKVINTK